MVEVVRAQAGVQVVEDAEVFRVVEAFVFTEQAVLVQERFEVVVAAFGEADLFGFFVDAEVAGAVFFFLRDEFGDDGIQFFVEAIVEVRGAGDDERGARLIYKDGIHFVDDGVVKFALQAVFGGERHVAAQVVEAEFVVGAVGDVAAVRRLFVFLRHAGDDDAGGHAEEAVEFAQFFAVAAGEVVVDGDDVHAFAGQGVQVDGQGGDQGFAFTGAHFGDFALVQHDAANHLYVVVAQAKDALAGFAHDGEGFGQELVEGFAFGEAFAEFGGFRLKGVVIEGLDLRFERVDFSDGFFVLLDESVVAGTENFCGETIPHKCFLLFWFAPLWRLGKRA